jgi:phage gpG-like protein
VPAFEINISGLAQLQERLAAAAGKIDVVTREATVVAASLAETAIKDQLRKSSHQKRTPTPSSPGSPPSLISGNLMRSIAVDGPSSSLGVHRAQIGPTAIYGRIQELGGATGRGHRTQLPARPYVAPAWQAVEPAVAAAYVTAWSRIFE